MEKHLIYVTTGTCHYSFDRMLELVRTCVNELSRSEYDLTLQYGMSTEVDMPSAVTVAQFLPREQAEKMYRSSRFVFSHCGIGSIYNSLKYNTPTIIIPRLKKYREFSDDHQLQIANEIKGNPLIFMLDESNDNYVADFLGFISDIKERVEGEVDLINYDLANKIKSVLYED